MGFQSNKKPKDKYFDQDPDVLAVYDFDYEAVVDFNYKLGVRNTLCMAFAIPYCWPCVPCVLCFVYHPMFLENVVDATEAQHVAVTRDGIKYVIEKHKTGCRCDCLDVGKKSKTVPFDKITDCDIQEPAGASGPCCCLVQNTLFQVNVDTASGTPGQAHELMLQGLKDPNQFKKDVWSMKRGSGIDDSPYSTGKHSTYATTGTLVAAPKTMEMNERAYVTGTNSQNIIPAMSPDGEAEMLQLMREQNRLLKKQNEILEAIQEK